MKFNTILGIAAALQISAVFADQFEVKWSRGAGAMLSFFTAWRSPRGSEPVTAFGEGCKNNPGPKGMQQLCLYNDGGYGWFVFEGEEWRCLSRSFKEGSDETSGREIWDEVGCGR
ncbi:hypothetical protein OQA88_13433 [Cercophora sp. LCS_1]